ncbi:mannosyltransferase [Actinoplanes derwentensis]|uniref:Mannosyltransferase n=2 Tax=Actinoplanes derwentensis TaxID=113562 RepID=A0A1H1VED6_9ACTN|nr:mannosyltransferase [Actinoplanes derwentensis]
MIRRWLPSALPGLAMLVIGLVRPTRAVLSWDEIATADVAQRSVEQIWRLVHHIDGVFGVYYLTMHLWTSVFGDSMLSLRLPSILAMAVAAALTGELGRRLFGPLVGCLAGGLLCLIPNISRYAAEARPYTIACMFSVLALLLLFRALDRPGPGRWVAYTAAITAMGLFSLVALVALAGHFAVVLARRGARFWVPWCAAVLAVLVVVSPLIWWGLRQRETQLHWVRPITAGGVYRFPELLTGSPEVAWLLIGLLLFAAFRPSRQILELAAVTLLPMAVLCAAAFGGVSFWINRYLLFVLLPAVIVAAAGLPRTRIAGLSALAVVAAASVPGQLAVRQPTVKNGSDYRTLAGIIERRQQPGDVIVLEGGRTMRAGIDFYLRHDPGRPRDVLLNRSAAQTATLEAAEHPDPVPRLAGTDRIWLVAYGRRADPASGRPDLQRMLDTDFQRAGRWTVKRGAMALYVRSPGP